MYLIKSDSPDRRPFHVWQLLAPDGLDVLRRCLSSCHDHLGARLQRAQLLRLPAPDRVSLFDGAPPAHLLGNRLRRLQAEDRELRRIAVGIVAVSSLCSAYLWGPFPFSLHHISRTGPVVLPGRAINKILDQLPPNVSRRAYSSFVLHIAYRNESTAADAVPRRVLGTFKQQGQRLPEADNVQYAMLPTISTHHPTSWPRSRINSRSSLQSSNAVLYKRKGT